MAKHGKHGLARREEIKDNLAGVAEIKPVYLSGTSIKTPPMPKLPASVTGELTAALGNFAGKQLQEISNARDNRAQLDGQTKAVQGQTFDQVSMEGDKWQKEGWALMNGMTISSSMVAAQVKQIENGGYAMSMEEFRNNYTARMADATRGQNPQIATAIRDEFTKQMPALIAKHTTMHLEHLEKKNYDALVQSIDALSQDPTAEDNLRNFATISAQSASAYLSDERKQSAIAKGVQVAFRNNNPLAYGFLRKNGLLEQLTLDQRNSVEASRSAFENRMRTEANEGLVVGLQELQTAFDAGEIQGPEMARRTAELLAEHNIRITQQEQADIYRQAGDLDNVRRRTQFVALENARLAKDWKVVGNITADIIEWIESKGKDVEGPLILHGANRGTKAQGPMQVVWNTLHKPGFGILPIQNNSTAEKRRVGREYWAALLLGREGGYGLTWDAGDEEATAIAYNAGPKSAKHWIASGRKYSSLPQTENSLIYWRNYQQRRASMGSPTQLDKYNFAVKLLATNKADHLVAATDAWQQNMRSVNAIFAKSSGSDVAIAAYRKGADLARDAANLAQSQASVAMQNAQQKNTLAAIAATRSKEQAAVDQAKYTLDMVVPNSEYADVMTDKKSSLDQRINAEAKLMAASNKAMEGQTCTR